ncbi:hypothetical protein Tco_1393355 [Tanacetum coccineum]
MMVGSSIYTITFVLTQRELDLHCATYGIPAELRPELPDRNSIIKDRPPGKIGMYTRFIEFANFPVPLSKFLLCILEYYQIHLSQLLVIGATKVSHFELMCRVVGCAPTVCTFRRFYVNSLSNGWLSFSRRSGADDPCCVSKKFDSLKNWNNHFFWIDATMFPLSVSWFNGSSIVKDPLPVEDVVDFLCLSCSFIENDIRPTVLCDDEGKMGLLDFVQSADPFKVKTGERTLATDERARTKDVSTSDAQPATAGKSHAALRRLIKQGASEAGGYGFVVPATEDIASSVTPTSEREYEDDFDHGSNVRIHPPSGRFTILSSSSIDTDIPASPQVVPSTIVVGSEDEVRDISAPKIEAGGSSISETETGTLSATPSHSSTDDFYDSQSVDSATAGDVYAALRNQSNVGFLNCFNINSAQHTSMVSELRLRFEHEIMSGEKFEKKFSESAAIVQQRDAEIADLKAKLGKAESEAAEVITLRQHVTELETAATARATEVVALNKRNAALSGKVSALGSVHGKLDGKISKLTDAAARRPDERVAEMNGCIADVKRDMDEHLYPYMFTAIAGQRWVIGHGLRLAVYKCARSAECRTTMRKVISMAINKGIQKGLKFENVPFPLLDKLDCLKDSLLAPIMSALTLKDDHGNVDTSPSFSGFQPSLDQVSIPIYSESGEVIREMLLSEVVPFVIRSAERRGLCPPSSIAPSTSIGISNYQISTLAQPHDDLFDTGVLDKPTDA